MKKQTNEDEDGLTPMQRSIERAAAVYYGGCRWAARMIRRLERMRRGHAD